MYCPVSMSTENGAKLLDPDFFLAMYLMYDTLGFSLCMPSLLVATRAWKRNCTESHPGPKWTRRFFLLLVILKYLLALDVTPLDGDFCEVQSWSEHNAMCHSHPGREMYGQTFFFLSGGQRERGS